MDFCSMHSTAFLMSSSLWWKMATCRCIFAVPFCPVSIIRKLSYLSELLVTSDERRTVLGERIREFSARTGKTHTRIIGWGRALEADDRRLQAQEICKVHFPLITLLAHIYSTPFVVLKQKLDQLKTD